MRIQYCKSKEGILSPCEKNEATYFQHSLTYTLSTSPVIALAHFFCCFNLLQRRFEYDNIYFNSSYNDQDLSEVFINTENIKSDSGKITNIEKKNLLPKVKMYLLTELASIQNPPEKYKGTCDILNKIGNHIINNPDYTFTEFVDQVLKNKDGLNNNQQPVIDATLVNIDQFATKKKLFTPCLGQIADDKNGYAWHYTEWHLIRDAEFRMNDGRLCIFNIENNETYKKHYAPNAKYHDIFVREMTHLSKILGFESDCNFHQEIIFTREATNNLLDQGLLVSLLPQKPINYGFFDASKGMQVKEEDLVMAVNYLPSK